MRCKDNKFFLNLQENTIKKQPGSDVGPLKSNPNKLKISKRKMKKPMLLSNPHYSRCHIRLDPSLSPTAGRRAELSGISPPERFSWQVASFFSLAQKF